MSDETKPALTPEEWATREARRGQWHDEVDVAGYGTSVRVRQGDESVFPTPARHALAALCLYQQPFGFTQEDVATALLATADLQANDDHVARLRSLASRIASLLPPEEK